MNFIEEVKNGQRGLNKGISMGKGMEHISKVLNGIQRGRVYAIAAPPKAGKSTLVDYAFVIQPYLESLEKNINVQWIYFSFEIDRVSKELDFAAHFLYYDHGYVVVDLEDGQLKDGKPFVEMSADYLRGRLQDDEGETILIKPEVFEKLKQVYTERIIPLFGEYDVEGNLVKEGKIVFVESKDNPTGLYKYLIRHGEKYGRFIKTPPPYERITGYVPNDPEKYTIVVTDHLRKLILERGWKMKETVDKYSEYTVDFKNWTKFTFVHVIHLNRWVDVARLKQFGDTLHPSSDDIKDTGNLSEDVDYLFTMFNPNDSRYNLKKHFGLEIRDDQGNELFPNLRTLHLVESRHCFFPQHFRVIMNGGFKAFKRLEI